LDGKNGEEIAKKKDLGCLKIVTKVNFLTDQQKDIAKQTLAMSFENELLLQCLIQPDQPHAECIVKAVVGALADDSIGVFGINDLDHDLVGEMLAVCILIGKNFHDENAFFVHIAVADSIALTNQGLAHIFQIFTADGRLVLVSHEISSFHAKINILCLSYHKQQKKSRGKAKFQTKPSGKCRWVTIFADYCAIYGLQRRKYPASSGRGSASV
jgi:hypothetical protein